MFNVYLLICIKHIIKDENFFISPFSISTALAMCHAGAKKETAKQLKDLLHLSSLSDSEIVELNTKYLENVNKNLGGEVVISTANKIYPNVGFEMKKEFLQILAKSFQSEVEQLNYGNPAEAAKAINSWVANQTKVY